MTVPGLVEIDPVFHDGQTGQTRINNYHHPERYLLPDDDTPKERPSEDDRGGP
ncbi:hypothetical protein [Mycolicibacterium hippocampi]|uniref:HNH endonuclease n=1 Tax=Mycolicibacterium hippocampi TaxID=659824 RepID=A0A850PM29_9MYCO|nr:hypothetical protein [Mycolicibacterium hippocampi]NVN48385.1 hypothetical protein [Mycolicibacterium hippocampi]